MARSWNELTTGEQVVVGTSLALLWTCTVVLLLVGMMSTHYWDGLLGIGSFILFIAVGGPLTADLFLGETHRT